MRPFVEGAALISPLNCALNRAGADGLNSVVRPFVEGVAPGASQVSFSLHQSKSVRLQKHWLASLASPAPLEQVWTFAIPIDLLALLAPLH